MPHSPEMALWLSVRRLRQKGEPFASIADRHSITEAEARKLARSEPPGGWDAYPAPSRERV